MKLGFFKNNPKSSRYRSLIFLPNFVASGPEHLQINFYLPNANKYKIVLTLFLMREQTQSENQKYSFSNRFRSFDYFVNGN